MPEEKEINLTLVVQNLRTEVAKLQVEFKYFRNVMVTLYLTVVAPLLVIVLEGTFGG